ncbi:hypothetical protein [Pedobacter rhodius]|uniref:Uncharacterized protein n=1 Tax=Pedobacter rhodius TaxID=3004098 RepID=A0ABT4KVL3_9SPHI|nr:hypothetical protein [Pedobacter sp. SJ11]MCZ4222957.1 hypothetical protein [Pedobacter sp. SJ11]
MNPEEFYKGQYDKSLAERTEINNSLSTPIGILTALLAGLYFCSTNFSYNCNPGLLWTFIIIAIISSVLLIVAIIYLILVFADFLKGRDYISLNDSDLLNKYYVDLVNFYNNQPGAISSEVLIRSKKEFDEYLLAELIRNSANNQRINRIKTALLFQSHKFMIYGLIFLSLLIVPFGIDFGKNRGKDKVQKVKIEQVIPIDLNIKYNKDTIIRLLLKPTDHGKASAIKRH